MSSTSLKDFEDKILNSPIAYGVSVNLGFFSDDLNLLDSDWQSEYKHENKRFSSKNQRLSFNYEIIPSDKNSNENIVSKHCIGSQSETNNEFFSKWFYAHVNWFV